MRGRGLGPKQRFLDGYAKVAGWRLAPELVVYWEVFANLRSAVITLRQARRHLTGRERSLSRSPRRSFRAAIPTSTEVPAAAFIRSLVHIQPAQ